MAQEKLTVLRTNYYMDLKNDTEVISNMTVNRSTKYCYYRSQRNMAIVSLFRREPE